MNYDALEDAIVARLQPIADAGHEVRYMPSKQSQHTGLTGKARITVQAGISKFDTTNIRSTSQTTVQDEWCYIEVIIQSERLRGSDGIYPVHKLARQLLLGWRPPNCTLPLQAVDFEGVDPSELRDSVWTYSLRMRTQTLAVGTPDEVDEDLITQITFLDGSTLGPLQPSIELYASDYNVDSAGDQVVLAWISSNADTVEINNGIGEVVASGSMTVTLSATTTYTISAVKGGSVVTASVTISVGAACAAADWVLKDTAGNTLDSGSIASGGSDEIEAPNGTVTAKNSAGTSLGSVSVRSGGSEEIAVADVEHTQSDGSSAILPSGVPLVCDPLKSLSVAVSNATPDYNGTVTIIATPSGITPTSYTFLIACQSDGDAYVTQASNVLVWTVNRVGAIKVSVTATNGSIEVGATADLTVTDPLNYAAKLVDYDMRVMPTLIDNVVESIPDSSGNLHHVTATTSGNYAYWDSYSKRYDTGSSQKDLRNLASNPLSGAGSFTMFAKFQKQASNATNQRLITFGASGAGFLVGLTSALGGDIVVGSNNFAQYTSASIVPQAGTPIAIVKNGTANYSIYANGSLATPTGTGGTVPATLPVANGIYLGTQNGSFGFTGAFQRIVIFNGALTATQIAAVNERIKVLHP